MSLAVMQAEQQIGLPVALRQHPDWAAAAQLIIDGCAYIEGKHERVRLLERLCDALGPGLYPGLIGVLCTIGERGTPAAVSAVADTLVEALYSGRVPSGRRVSWGGVTTQASLRNAPSVGPIEYLCALYVDTASPQRSQNAATFEQLLRSLLRLFSQAGPARALYCERLRAVADDTLGGTLSRETRDGLRRLAAVWENSGTDLQAPVEAFIGAVEGSESGMLGLRHLSITVGPI